MLTSGGATEDFREVGNSPVGNGDEKEDEELLGQAIALSEENFQENDVEELLRELEAWK